MLATILHGGAATDAALEAIHTATDALLRAQGWTVNTLRLDGMTIRPCAGCFNCWLRTPGLCGLPDDGHQVVQALVRSEALIYLTPLAFGGFGHRLKSALDRIIPWISPLFCTIEGEMHHHQRYPRAPILLGVGWQPHPDPESSALFTRLVQRNALNMHAPTVASTVLSGEQSLEESQRQLAAVIAQLEVDA
jgi:hypothetical protein